MIHKVMNNLLYLTLVLWAWAMPAAAQSADEVVWIQIEAQSSLRAGTEAASGYA